jgi:catechol 2,3-dioxygenase-like lactoylglutathione lyase family enzyme
MIEIEALDHIGIRVADEDVAMKFYEVLGFKFHWRATGDAVVIIRNPAGVEINLVINANDDQGGKNILIDVPTKIPGITHVAYDVKSLKKTMETLAENNIKIRQGPVVFSSGHVSVFIRDPDLNVIELRGNDEDAKEIETEEYVP